MEQFDSIINMTTYVAEQICDHYCKYPAEYKDNDQMYDEKCDKCPLQMLI